MDWVKENYEKVILAVLIVAALVTAYFVYSSATGLPDTFSGRTSPKPPDHTIPPAPVESIDHARDVFDSPQRWQGHDGTLFVSRPYVLSDGKLVDPLEGGTDLHPPIPNAWLIRYDLDYADGSIKDLDADSDGFTNLDEFLAGTDPTRKDSIPPYYTKLVLKEFISKPFRLKFTGSPDAGTTFTINSRDGGRRTQFLKIGDKIDGAPYEVTSYEEKYTEDNQIQKDVSELTLTNTETGQTIVLVAGKEANDPTSFGEFLYYLDNSTFTVKKEEEFVLPSDPDTPYKLVDISASEAVIQNTKTGETYKILKSN